LASVAAFLPHPFFLAIDTSDSFSHW